LFVTVLPDEAFVMRAGMARLKVDGARASITTERSLPRRGKRASSEGKNGKEQISCLHQVLG